MAGRVKPRRRGHSRRGTGWHREPGCGGIRWRRGRVGRHGVGERANKRGPCISEGEREKTPRMEDVNRRRKRILCNTPKARAGQAGRRTEQWPTEEAGWCGEAELAGPDPKREFKGNIYF
jgi:hypothetical protein